MVGGYLWLEIFFLKLFFFLQSDELWTIDESSSIKYKKKKKKKKKREEHTHTQEEENLHTLLVNVIDVFSFSY